MKTVTDKTVETCRAALAQVLRDAKKHAATAEGMTLDSMANWQKPVADIQAADAELAGA